jgi:hypothetical protein
VEEAVRELKAGMVSQLGRGIGQDVQKALTNLERSLHGSPRRRAVGTDPIHASLWAVGSSLGEECWLNGHGAGVRRKAPAEGKIRVDLTVTEVLQLGGLANLGFQHMMPNMRIIETKRFSGKEDALEASRSVSQLEASIPKKYRPDLLLQAHSRDDLIEAWWKPVTRMFA